MTDEIKPAVIVGTRDQRGRFAIGNRCGPGAGAFSKRVNAFRRVMLAAITEDDIREIAQQLVTAAKSGDVFSARLVLSYCLGDPAALTQAAVAEEQTLALAEVSTYVAFIPAPPAGDTQEEQIANWSAGVKARSTLV